MRQGGSSVGGGVLLGFVFAVFFLVRAGLAEVAYALTLTPAGELVSFKTDHPDKLLSAHFILGLQTNEQMVAIDFGAGNVLYGVGSFNHLYKIDLATATATPIQPGGKPSAIHLNGTVFGFAIDPSSGEARITSDLGQNFRVSTAEGLLTGVDSALTWKPGDVNYSPLNLPRIEDIADGPGVRPTLYGLDGLSGSLVRIGGPNGSPSPDGGQVSTIRQAPLEEDAARHDSLDILPDGRAFLLSRGGGVENFYSIDLSTGAVALIGPVETGNVSGNDELILGSLAIEPIPEPCGLGLLVGAVVLLPMRSRVTARITRS